jgi:anti-repressor protein
MNDLQIMNISGVDCYEKDGTAYLKLETVARGLGFTRTADSGNEVVRWERVHKYLGEIGFMPTSGHDDFIPENIFYRLAMKAKNETAERFQALVADEIIPSIRKNGGYIANQENLTPEQIVANALIVAQNIISQKDKQIEQMKPKAEFFDAVADSRTAISMNEVSKVLGIKGYGRNNLFEFLRNNGILDRWNVPYQRYIDCGWFRVIEQKYTRHGEPCVTTKTLVYQKGVDAIRKKILSADKTV